MPSSLRVELHSRLDVLSPEQLVGLFGQESALCLPPTNAHGEKYHSITVFWDNRPLLFIPVLVTDTTLSAFIKEPRFVLKVSGNPRKVLWVGKVNQSQGCIGAARDLDPEVLSQGWEKSLQVLNSLAACLPTQGIVFSGSSADRVRPPINQLPGFISVQKDQKYVIFKLSCPITTGLLSAAPSAIQPA